MRLIFKFSAIVVVAVCCQLLIIKGLDPLDEAQFTARVYVAHLCGEPMDNPELIDMGARMLQRQIAREQARKHRLASPAPPATMPALCAAGDEVDW
jgi:hypothetical protein